MSASHAVNNSFASLLSTARIYKGSTSPLKRQILPARLFVMLNSKKTTCKTHLTLLRFIFFLSNSQIYFVKY